MAELDVAAMTEHFSNAAEPLRQLSFSEQAMRALSLLESVVEASHDRLQGILEQAGESVRLRLVWIVPPRWCAFDLSALKAWLQTRFSLLADPNTVEISVIPVANEVDALRSLDEIILHGNRQPGHRALTLLLGSVSSVDELTVEEWANTKRLFSAQHQQRQIPGEGAVALLLASSPLVAGLAPERFGPRDRVAHVDAERQQLRHREATPELLFAGPLATAVTRSRARVQQRPGRRACRR